MTDMLPGTREARAVLGPVLSAEIGDDFVLSTLARAAWCHLVEPGDGVAGRLIAALGPESALAEVTSGGDGDTARLAAEITAKEWSDAVDRWRPRWDRESLLASLALAARSGIRLLVPEHEDWPAGLDDLGPHAPVCLWVHGEAAALSRTTLRVAVVGARAASSYGEHVAAELAAELSGRGVTVVSGAAYGIDGAAHRAALHGGGTTIAVLAGGVDRPYPAGHADLIGRIAQTGAVISEVPCGSAPTKWRSVDRTTATRERCCVPGSCACNCSVVPYRSRTHRSGSWRTSRARPSLRLTRSCWTSGRRETRSRVAGRTRSVSFGGIAICS